MKTKQIPRFFFQLFFIISALLILSVSTSAATQKSTWYTKNGRYYYYDKKGELVHGTKKINGKYYYFNSKGRQRNGWIVSKGRYYFFKNEPGKGGYRLSNTTVNGIQLQANGIAVVTNQNKTKLTLLTKANQMAYELCALNVSKEQRLKKCYNHLVYSLRYRNLPHGFRSTGDWAAYYASYALLKGYGDCYCSGSGMAYMATAIGCTNVYAVSSGGHGWCEINGKVYDPNWGRMTGDANRYFGFTRNMLTKKDPNYFRSGMYKSRID